MLNELTQLDLGLSQKREIGPPRLAPLELIAKIRCRRDAYKKCIDEAVPLYVGTPTERPLTNADVAAFLQIEEAQFNRILNGGGRYLDDEKELLLGRVCGNKIPTQWLAYQDGFELKPIRSELERQLIEKEQENRELRRELETLVKYGVIGRKA